MCYTHSQHCGFHLLCTLYTEHALIYTPSKLQFFNSVRQRIFTSESIEGTIEHQAFSPSYYFDPSPYHGEIRASVNRGGEGKGAKLHDGEKAWSSIIH
jgi:hypothetical protein